MIKRIVYDIECLPNFFCVVVCDLDSDEQYVFEISFRKQEHDQIIHIAEKHILIGYNSHNYDDVLIKYIMSNPKCTNMDLYKVSRDIITNNCANYKKYKKDCSMESIDIMTMLASSKLRVSLKHLQVVINWHNVQEFEVDWDAELPMNQWEACIEYCFNDVLSLKAVCQTLSKDFELRKFVHNTTGIACYSKDPVKIAEYTMAKAIAESKGLNTDSFIWDTVEKNVPVREINIGNLILPFISFKTTAFKSVLDTYKNFILCPEEERAKPKSEKFKLPVKHGNMYLNFGLGGLHHDYQRSLTIKPPVGCKLIQSDV